MTRAERSAVDLRPAWAATFRVGRLFGVDLLVSWQLLLVIAAHVAVATPLSPLDVPGLFGLSPVTFVWYTTLAMVVSVFAHEMGHALAGKAMGLGVRSICLGPAGGHTLHKNPTTSPGDEFRVSFAGPAVNVLVAGVFAVVALREQTWEPFGAIGTPVFYANALLLTNLLPTLPMDGGRMYAAILWGLSGDRAGGTERAEATGNILAGVIILGGAAGVWYQFGWMFGLLALGWALGVLMPEDDKASGATRFQHVHGLTVRDLVAPPLRAQADDMARALVQDRIQRTHSSDLEVLATLDLPYLVYAGGRVVGVVPPSRLHRLTREHLDWTRVRAGDVMEPIDDVGTVVADADAFTAVVYMAERQAEWLAVVDGPEFLGCVTPARLERALIDRENAAARQGRAPAA